MQKEREIERYMLYTIINTCPPICRKREREREKEKRRTYERTHGGRTYGRTYGRTDVWTRRAGVRTYGRVSFRAAGRGTEERTAVVAPASEILGEHPLFSIGFPPCFVKPLLIPNALVVLVVYESKGPIMLPHQSKQVEAPPQRHDHHGLLHLRDDQGTQESPDPHHSMHEYHAGTARGDLGKI